MSPDDKRHGTTRGFHAGCRESCCRAAWARYEKESRLLRHTGRQRSVPALGAQRRIQALMALGWGTSAIADAAGWSHRNQVLRILNGQKGKPTTWLERHTYNTVAEVYDQLSMKLPPNSPHARRTATTARRKGYLPPLMWDDGRLDDPTYRPSSPTPSTRKWDDVDEAVVLRVLAGERLPTTRAEKQEVMARWLAAGKSGRELARIQGWNDGRYSTSEAF